jgi:hypothetical protein
LVERSRSPAEAADTEQAAAQKRRKTREYPSPATETTSDEQKRTKNTEPQREGGEEVEVAVWAPAENTPVAESLAILQQTAEALFEAEEP